MIAGALEIQLLANVARLQQDMDKAKSTVNATMGGIEKAVSSATKVLGALGIGLSVNYFGRMIQGAINTQDELAKMSQKIGVSVEGLAGLKHAADLSGSSLGGIEKALKTVSTQMFDASKGLAEPIRNFAALGVNIHTATGELKSADQVMIEAADRFASMEDGANKTALAVKLFGKSGLELIPMLNGGSAALAEMVAEGQRLNPVTAESAKQAELYNDNILRLKNTVGALGISFVNNLLPHISAFSQSVIDFTRSDEFPKLLDRIALAAKLLAGIIGVNLVASLTASAAGFIANTHQSIAYQAALARMAGVSTSAALAQSALAGATAVANRALMLVGGPVGGILIAAAAVYKLTEYFMNLRVEMARMSGAEFAQQELSVMGLSAEQASINIDAAKEALARLDLELLSAKELHGENSDEVAKLVKQLDLQQNWLNLNKIALAEANATTAEATEESIRLAKSQEQLEKDIKAATAATGKQAQATEGVIESLQDEIRMLSMTARQQDIYNKLKALGENATFAARLTVIAWTNALWDEKDALAATAAAKENASKQAAELAKASTAAAKQIADGWDDMRVSAGRAFADFLADGKSAAESLKDTFKRMSQEILGQALFTGGLKLAGVNLPGGSGGGISGILESSGIAGTITKGIWGSLTKGVAGSASFVGPVLPGAAASAGGAAGLGGTITGVIGAIPGWGWAALGAAAIGALLNNDDGYKRANAGLLTAPTPGAKSQYTFAVDQFASGFSPTGFARREDQSKAMEYIDTLRALDLSVDTLVEKLGGDLTVKTLHGLNEEATPGSKGTFLGGGRDADLAGQVNWFVRQLMEHVTGLDQSLIDAAKSAGSATEAIAILERAVLEKEQADVAVVEVMKEAEQAAKELVVAEGQLMKKRLDIIGDLTSELSSAVTLHRSFQASIHQAMGASPLFDYGNSFEGQLRALSEQRDLIVRNHAEQMRAEEQLHNARMQAARDIEEFTAGVRMGDFSNFNPAGKLDFAQGRFRDLAASAQGGDLDALRSLQGAAQGYIESADQMFASGQGRKDVVAEVLAVMDSLGAQLGSSEFDPAQANADLIAQLQALDAQLIEIGIGVNNKIISELQNINVTLTDLTPAMYDTLTGAIGQWIETATPGGQGIIAALSGIKGSVDELPPEIAGYMTAVMRAMLQANGNQQRTVEGLATGSIPKSAGEQALIDQGFNLNYGADEIASHVARLRGEIPDEMALIREVYAQAVAGGVGSAQLADVLGYTQQQVLDAAAAAGLPAFANGGNYQGGLALVGERGPELIDMSPGRVYNNRDSMQMLSRGGDNSEVVAELRALRDENRAQRDELAEIKRVLIIDAEMSIDELQKQTTELTGINQKADARSAVGSGAFKVAV